jgi:glycosyltransferase involved in cell wall biosynthesis
MFVIACRNDPVNNYIVDLVDDIRKYHASEEILIVDSDSPDKSYFTKVMEYSNVIVADVRNPHYFVGAYKYAFMNFGCDFYYMMHDTMRVKANLDFLKERDLSIMATFDRTVGGDTWNNLSSWVHENTGETFNPNGLGVYGCIFFAKHHVLNKLYNSGIQNFMPNNKHEACISERLYGWAFENMGYDLRKCALYGDFFGGITEQKEIEKFYAHRP